jgi:hypothetical protein
MKVKELIEKLREVDGDLEVVFYLRYLGTYENNVVMISREEKDADMWFVEDSETHCAIVYLG